jgi:hypothetical protein
MRQARWVLVLRSIIAALMLTLGVANLTSGRVLIGVLLIGLATMNVALTVTMRRRRAQLLERFPGLAPAAAARRTVPTGQ